MSGSEKRQRTDGFFVRCTGQEKAAIEAKADLAGIEPSGYLREAGLGTATPRTKRRPPADLKALRELLGHCGSIGNNLNQIARCLNTGGTADIPELTEACTAYLKIRDGIFQALGMAPHDNQWQ